MSHYWKNLMKWIITIEENHCQNYIMLNDVLSSNFNCMLRYGYDWTVKVHDVILAVILFHKKHF